MFFTSIFLYLQQNIMSQCLQRFTIHPRICNKGKLRKIQHHKVDSQVHASHLLFTPKLVVQDILSRRQKLHCFFRKQQHASFVFSGLPSPGEQASGSFRAIHTAHPQDAIRGFPLRSITPIRPFRRGVRSPTCITKRQELPSFISMEEPKSVQNNNLSEMLTTRPPSLVQNEEIEEFYKYKESSQEMGWGNRQNEGKLAGSRLEPFKKYHIRESYKAPKTHRVQLQ